jgi:glutaredoxin 3
MQTVRMYSTDWCPYCRRAKALLKSRGVDSFEDIDLDREPGRRAEMIQQTGRYTVPQIFIGGVHVGGCDDLVALDRRGALAPLLAGEEPTTRPANGRAS